MKPTVLLTAAALIASAASALAQAPPPPGGEAASPPPMQGRFGGGAARRAEMAADVHTILHIRPDQEGAFQTFMTELHRPHAPPQNAATGSPPPPPSPPPEVDAAYQGFSAVLTPDQQQVLAALRRLALDRPRWGGGHGMRHAMGGAPPDGEPQ